MKDTVYFREIGVCLMASLTIFKIFNRLYIILGEKAFDYNTRIHVYREYMGKAAASDPSGSLNIRNPMVGS
jgi:hypothetical protein